MSEQLHRSDARILNRRTLQRDHPRLTSLLGSGMSVLDVGCGTGAITAGIARVIGPEGHVVGIDRDGALLTVAREEHGRIHNLTFEDADALHLSFERRFDIVTAARTLQWISRPEVAIAQIKKAGKSGGRIVILDYNHENNSWEPDPPAGFRHFYKAFLNWRTANNWDNRMADHLPTLFRSAGITDVEIHLDNETVQRGDRDFFDAAATWSYVTQSVGSQIVAAGFLREDERFQAENCYQEWVQSGLLKQVLSIRTVGGRIP